MNHLKSVLLGVWIAFIACPASAVDRVSRSCNFSTIPAELKPVSLLFFRAMGAPSSVMNILNNNEEVYWIFESLTTDAFQVRYYLAAISTRYTKGVDSSGRSAYFVKNTTYSGWTAEAISDAMKADGDFSPYYVNRGILYSARAGNPNIVEFSNDIGKPADYNLVIGQHFYYDPVSKAGVTMGNTRATTCNLSKIGYSWSLFDR
jgi:hypothetical protein